MSSFAARFYFHGGDPAGYDVHACDYFFDQSTDDKGRPSSTVQGGAIVLVLPSNDDTHALNWMFDPYAQKDGWVDFYRADQRSVMKKVAFTKAYCVGYSERFLHGLDYMITLSSESITVAGATHTNKW